MESKLINRLSALSHPQRMDVFRLLMRRCPDEVQAGEIASALHLKASTASVYLSALTRCGLITQRRSGTRLLYAVNLAAVQDVISDLFLDCCRGRAELCLPEPLASAAKVGEKPSILFLCSKNSARSIFAEALLKDRARDSFSVFSAGLASESELHPVTLDVLSGHGHDISQLRSKSVSEFHQPEAKPMDVVLTVCDLAANDDSPSLPGHPIASHWGVADPVMAGGSAPEQRFAFEQAYTALARRIDTFAALPFSELDRTGLQRALDDIGRATTCEGSAHP